MARCSQGETLADEALLTGESRPVPRGVGAAVIAGSHNLNAPVLVRVERTGAETRFAQIVALMEQAATSRPQLGATGRPPGPTISHRCPAGSGWRCCLLVVE